MTRRSVYGEDVEHLLRCGESPSQIAATLGIALKSVARGLRRDDRPDLAVIFERAVTETAPEPPRCPCGSGKPVVSGKWCRSCLMRQRWAEDAAYREAATRAAAERSRVRDAYGRYAGGGRVEHERSLAAVTSTTHEHHRSS